MAKRLTDSDKWKDPWFKKLKGEMQLLWIFVLDTCDHAGIWKDQLDDFNHITGFSVTYQDMALHFQGRILALNSETFIVPKFITFQYTNFNPERNNAHKGVLRSLSNYGVKYDEVIDFINSERFSIKTKEAPALGLRSPSVAPQDKEQEQEKDIDMDKEQEQERWSESQIDVNEFIKAIKDLQ